MTDVLRAPLLLFAFGVERLRRIPGARILGPLMPLVAGLLLAGALAVVLLSMAEASPQRISLADLAAGKLSHMQSWVIVSGELREEAGRGSGDLAYRYRLTDPAAPNAYLGVISPTQWPVGQSTVSGRVEGGTDGVPVGYEWSATLRADARLAEEPPPPWLAFLLVGLGLAVIVARRVRYPMFIAEAPSDVTPASSALRATVRGGGDSLDGRAQLASLVFAPGGRASAELRLQGRPPVPVKLHSAFTSVDVGRLRGLKYTEPALRVNTALDDLTISFASKRDRDAAFAALRADATRPRRGEVARPRPSA